MKRLIPLAAALFALPASPPASAEDAPVTPVDIVNAAPQEEWVVIPPEDLLVMDLAPDAEGQPRRVVIQLMPAPFSQGWVGNIRTLAAAHWWDGTSVYRVQDNYVVQWGDVTEEKPLPDGLNAVAESDYTTTLKDILQALLKAKGQDDSSGGKASTVILAGAPTGSVPPREVRLPDSYSGGTAYFEGWPIAMDASGSERWPVHCYGMVGVARDLETTGSGSDLYVVIGQAPRQLDRNIAVVGRVISGIENLSALPRGRAEAGFYGDEEAARRVPILSVRLGSELPEAERPLFEYLSTTSDSFARYLHSRANRQDDFYKVPAGGVDICNAPVPVRAFEYAE